MSDNQNDQINIQENERITSVMIYTANFLTWGEVVTKEAIRVSTWLRTPALPQYILLHNAQLMNFGASNPKPQSFKELHLPSSKVIGFHIKPPDHDPLDFDPDEPMRKMEPVTALIGPFRFDGTIRMSTQTNLERFLDVAKEIYTSMYDLEITQPSFPNMGIIRTPMALVRIEHVLFSPREI
jgi:hypothetical protein